MDGYQLGKLLFDANSKPSRRLGERLANEPEAVIAEYQLSERAAAAVRDKDLRAMYEMNVHPLLVRMGYMALFGRISAADERSVTVDVDGEERTIGFDQISKAVIQVEMNRRLTDDHDEAGE